MENNQNAGEIRTVLHCGEGMGGFAVLGSIGRIQAHDTAFERSQQALLKHAQFVKHTVCQVSDLTLARVPPPISSEHDLTYDVITL